MTEKSLPDEAHRQPTLKELAESTGPQSIQPPSEIQDPTESGPSVGAKNVSPENQKSSPSKSKEGLEKVYWIISL